MLIVRAASLPCIFTGVGRLKVDVVFNPVRTNAGEHALKTGTLVSMEIVMVFTLQGFALD